VTQRGPEEVEAIGQSRRRLIVDAFWIAAGVATAGLSACSAPRRTGPTPTAGPTPSPTDFTPKPRILDLTNATTPKPRPDAVTAAVGAVARLWVDNPGVNHNVTSAVHIGRGLFVGPGHFNRGVTKTGAIGDVEMSHYRARLAVMVGGRLIVLQAVQVANLLTDPNSPAPNDIALFAVPESTLPPDLAIARPTDPRDLEDGSTIHLAGYLPVPGTQRDTIPIDRPAQLAGIRGVLLGAFGGQGVDVMVGRPDMGEGAFGVIQTDQEMSGGGAFSDSGSYVAGISGRDLQVTTIGAVKQNHSYDSVIDHGVELPDTTAIQVVNCQAQLTSSIAELTGRLAPIPAP